MPFRNSEVKSDLSPSKNLYKWKKQEVLFEYSKKNKWSDIYFNVIRKIKAINIKNQIRQIAATG